MNQKFISRKAVGRVARLGDLYDFRTDTFVDFSAFYEPVTDDDIEIIKMPLSDFRYINDGNIMEKFEKLGIEPELRASILANLVSLGGHGKYLETESKTKKMRKSIFYSIRTQVDKLILSEELPFALDSLDLDFATHFVVGIVWGANTIITLEEKDYNANAELAYIELKAELEKLEKSISELQRSIYDFSKDKYSVEMFSDILPTASNLPKTVEEAKETLKKISRLVQTANRGKGKQIEYLLMSISDLDDYLNDSNTNEVFSSVDENAINNMTNFIGEIMVAKREINDVVFRFDNHANYIPLENFRELSQMKSEIEKQEMKLRNKFKDAIIAIRSGNCDFDLINTIYTLDTNDVLSDEIKIRLNEFDKLLMKIDVIDKIKTQKIGFIGSDVPIGLDEIKRLSHKVYILYLRAGVKEFNIELWNQNKLYFLHLCDKLRYSSSKTSKYAFVGIDLDVRQDLKMNDKEEGALISLIDNGNVVDSDIYGTYLRQKNTCYAKIYGWYENQPKPSRRIELRLKCPGSFKSICKGETYKWHCFKCKEALSFGFDGFFYCSCGRAPSMKFSYKCTDQRHVEFLSFTDKQLKKLLSEIPPLDELNVLILGVTGVGKSTWINAFLNYLAFPSLEEAWQGELLSATASAFQLTDEDDVTHTIRFGHDENEVLEPGQSATQDVKAHLFPIGNTLLRLIDTPGIGDMRGIEEDKKNFDKILKYLSTLKYLNGICILLKSNESRLDVLFEFCVKELLTHLHKNASKNIVFCFTHSRETFYKPGDTRQPLGELLLKNQIDLNLHKDTMYCMDNESFRFLCAANQGIQFRESVMKSFSESWTISVEETNRLILHFKTMQPHVIEDTISLNDARKNIVCLTKPIADISRNIQQNLALIKDKQDLLTSSNASKQDLVKMLYFDTIKLETEPLNHPRTVCGAPSCVEYHPAADGTVEAIEYGTDCHPHCYLNGVPVSIVGDTRLKQCKAMNRTTLNCTQCGCSWDQHLNKTYVQNRVTERITVQDVQSRITGKESEEQQIQAFIETVEDMRSQQEEEQRKMIEVSLKLGRYLSKNAILPYNDALGRYIDHLIDKEEQKVICGGTDEILKRLKAMKEMYEEEEKALIAAILNTRMNKDIKRNAVGRMAILGDLYDARTDTFVGFSILNGPIPDAAKCITKNTSTDMEYITTENINEKFNILDIEPELRASILANLVSLDGHGKYLETETNNNVKRKSMVITTQNKFEKLINCKELKPILSLDFSYADLATHFVGEIIWGQRSVVAVDVKNNNKEIESKIDEDLSKVLSILRESILNEDVNRKNAINDCYSITVFTDILLGNLSQKTVEEVVIAMKKIKDLMKISRGKPISYTLMPISALYDHFPKVKLLEKLSFVDEKAILNFTNLIEEFQRANWIIDDVLTLFESQRYCIPTDAFGHLIRIKSDIVKRELKCRSEFKDAIVEIRSGKAENYQLEKICSHESGFLVNEVKNRLQIFDSLHQKINVITHLRSKGVLYIGADYKDGIDGIVNLNRQFYVLYILSTNTESTNIDLWTTNIDYFTVLLRDSFEKNDKISFVVVDLDIRPDLALDDKGKVAEICLVKDGKFVDLSVLETHFKEKSTCYAKAIGEYENHPKPANRTELKLKCPGFGENVCGNATRKWICRNCKEPLNFGFDEYFYCSCGRAPCENFSFKCCDARHGEEFVKFQSKSLEEALKAIPPLEELNVLVLGVTGVGKSTWINAILNYLTFPSLEVASKNQLLTATSTKFLITDDDYVSHTIKFGIDENEVLEAGQSATQDVRAHVFAVGNTLVRLIDTPGIGDVRGVERDKKNFEKILSYLSTLKYLNGICILLKPNESRLNVLFEFCVKELLGHLHKNATRNVVFCFTHSRETFYKPGDTRQPLGELLWKNQIDLNLDKDTMYCMDNECFRFLCAINYGFRFKESVVKAFSQSWNTSVEETNRLISYFKKLEPHVIDDTISLNDARKNIVCLTKPIADISDNIQRNLALIKDKKDALISSSAIEDQLSKMYLDTIKIEAESLVHPRTVCTSKSCVKYHPASDGRSDFIEYVTNCHSECDLTDTAVDIVGDERLKSCSAIDPKTLNCLKCGCSWDRHMHLTYVLKLVQNRIMNPDVKTRLEETKSNRDKIKNFVRHLEQICSEQEEEQRKIIEVSVKLGRYLSKNSMLPFNDVMGRYIDHLIEMEEQKCSYGGNDRVLRGLKSVRLLYSKKQRALEEAMSNLNANELTRNDFQRLMNELYSYQHNGAQLQKMIEQASMSYDGPKTNDKEKVYANLEQNIGQAIENSQVESNDEENMEI